MFCLSSLKLAIVTDISIPVFTEITEIIEIEIFLLFILSKFAYLIKYRYICSINKHDKHSLWWESVPRASPNLPCSIAPILRRKPPWRHSTDGLKVARCFIPNCAKWTTTSAVTASFHARWRPSWNTWESLDYRLFQPFGKTLRGLDGNTETFGDISVISEISVGRQISVWVRKSARWIFIFIYNIIYINIK